jgi:SpoVK/Ycf46/Vps4 family AAA+-type ATPase
MSDHYQSSAEHVFARVEKIRARALVLLEGRSDVTEVSADLRAERDSEAAHIELRLPALARRFGLSAIEVDTLVCLLAAEYDPVVRTLERALQREMGKPWLELGTMAELLGLPADRIPTLSRALLPDAPLRRWALVRTDDPRGTELPAVFTRVKIATRVAQHLVGQDLLPDGLSLCAPARELLGASLVSAETRQGLVGRLQRGRKAREPVVVEVSGSAGTGRRALVEGLAHVLGAKLVIGDLAADGLDDPSTLDERVAVARREAALQGALLALVGWMPAANDTPAIDDGTRAPTQVEHRLPRAIERIITELTDVVFLIAEEREPLLARIAPTLVHVAVPFPSPGQRAQLLESAVHKLGARLTEGMDVQLVTRRFALDPERIEIAARGAREHALERLATEGTEPAADATITLSVGDLQEACRHQLRHDLKSLAQRVTNAHKWEDLVIPVDVYHSLREMISYVRHAEHVYDRWGFGARHSLAQGVSALFAGPPGTGKTMCASVMARELDMELFRVDLSRIVSKWIGETEKNLGKVFDEADRSNAIILFDEADALFAKRTEVKSSVDRYANLEINFLLQRMESFGGVTILTTNFEDTIDTAFKRRLTFRMRFEKPDAEARGALWKKIFPKDAQLAGDLDLDQLGAQYELAGGNIRNAAVRAAFLAAAADGPIDMNMCMLAAEREAREMGLLVRSATEPDAASEETDEDREAGEARAQRIRDLDAPQASRGRSRIVPVTRPRRRSE